MFPSPFLSMLHAPSSLLSIFIIIIIIIVIIITVLRHYLSLPSSSLTSKYHHHSYLRSSSSSSSTSLSHLVPFLSCKSIPYINFSPSFSPSADLTPFLPPHTVSEVTDIFPSTFLRLLRIPQRKNCFPHNFPFRWAVSCYHQGLGKLSVGSTQ